MHFVILFPETVRNLFFPRFKDIVFYNAKYLIRRRFKIQWIAFSTQSLPKAFCSSNCRYPNFNIQIILKECIKLKPKQSPLCQECPVLLNDRKKMRYFLRFRNDTASPNNDCGIISNKRTLYHKWRHELKTLTLKCPLQKRGLA